MDVPDERTWVDMRLSRVIMRDNSEEQWIFLSETGGTRGFPIIIGRSEAQEIRRVVTGVRPGRPLTHQLTFDSIEALGARLERVDIVDLRENTFYARLVLREASGGERRVDARPSDAVAIGLRAGCPIRVAEEVLDQVRTDTSGPDPLPEKPDPDPDPKE
jgi:hypothetical protein